MEYEDQLIREANGENWPLDRTEATADWYDHHGLETEAYTHEEADTRREEANL